MRAVNLHAIKPCFFCPDRRIAIAFNDFITLRSGQRSWFFAYNFRAADGAGRHNLTVKIFMKKLPSAMPELHSQFTASPVNRVCHPSECRNKLVCIERRIAQRTACHMYRRYFNQIKSISGLCPAGMVGRQTFAVRILFQIPESRSHRRKYGSVF